MGSPSKIVRVGKYTNVDTNHYLLYVYYQQDPVRLVIQHILHTLSTSSCAMSKCRKQQAMASSNLPSTFSVLPRLPLALASPTLSPSVLF